MKRPVLVDVGLLLGLLLLPVLAGTVGSQFPQTLRLNLGPLDEPWIAGFTERHEVQDGVGVHWSLPQAEIRWPVVVRGDGLRLEYRVARILPETAQVLARVNGTVVDRFACRGGVWLTRGAAAAARGDRTLTVAFDVDSHDRRGLGLLFDHVEVEVPQGSHVGLPMRWSLRGAATAALVSAVLGGLGWGCRQALCAGLVVALVTSAGFLTWPWTTVLLLRGVPEGLLVFGGAGVALARLLCKRVPLDRQTLQRVGALALVAFLVRAVALNHPDWYYPDLMVHTKMALKLRELGPSFFLHPAQYVDEHGAWTKPVWGGKAPLPYTVTWHLPFALLGLSYDATLQAMKTTAAAVTVVPLVVAAALAGAFGAGPVLTAVLMLAIPTYLSRMAVSLLPALLGHATDMLVLLALLRWGMRLDERRIALRLAAVIGVGYLSYVSSVTNLSLFVGLLALALATLPPQRPRDAGRLLITGLLGAGVAVAVYYRDFLLPLLTLPDQARAAASVYAPTGFLDFLTMRTHAFFDSVHPLVALVGLGLALTRRRQPAFALAWLAAYLALILLRAKLPDVFRYGHETLWATPLICLMSAAALTEARQRSNRGRLVAALIVVFLVVQGALGQWQALAGQLGNAR